MRKFTHNKNNLFSLENVNNLVYFTVSTLEDLQKGCWCCSEAVSFKNWIRLVSDLPTNSLSHWNNCLHCPVLHPLPRKSVHSATAEPVLTEHNQSSFSLLLPCTGLTRRHIIELGDWAHTNWGVLAVVREGSVWKSFCCQKSSVSEITVTLALTLLLLCFLLSFFFPNISAIALRLPLPSKSADWTHFGGKQHCMSTHSLLVEK